MKDFPHIFVAYVPGKFATYVIDSKGVISICLYRVGSLSSFVFPNIAQKLYSIVNLAKG